MYNVYMLKGLKTVAKSSDALQGRSQEIFQGGVPYIQYQERHFNLKYLERYLNQIQPSAKLHFHLHQIIQKFTQLSVSIQIAFPIQSFFIGCSRYRQNQDQLRQKILNRKNILVLLNTALDIKLNSLCKFQQFRADFLRKSSKLAKKLKCQCWQNVVQSKVTMYVFQQKNKQDQILQHFVAFSDVSKCEHFLASKIRYDSIRQL
eukprot:TRINITY_DN9830_c0_g1_i2.p1 TRINITY_DN9830_c0_g1~~TRINITY_DN9830_c0_g1_i2.p1  ORF type:complete len:204 (-),score=-7.01 TRINITY_DN9830_c0_g1_i2:56-667(-)